jgi:hypothetical protein
MRDKLTAHWHYITQRGADMPELREWQWPGQHRPSQTRMRMTGSCTRSSHISDFHARAIPQPPKPLAEVMGEDPMTAPSPQARVTILNFCRGYRINAI